MASVLGRNELPKDQPLTSRERSLKIAESIVGPLTSILGPGEELPKDQPLMSPNGRYLLVLQQDGNLVLYEDGHARWASRTDGQAVQKCVMQGDGNLVIYGFNNKVVWASGTPGNPRSFLTVQGDRNVVIYRLQPTWSTGTVIS